MASVLEVKNAGLAMSFSVGVVIPVYNQAHYLADAVRSVLGQTHPVSQIVIVNDGSTDNSLNVAQSFGEAVVVVTKQNGGLSSARNFGLSHIETEWVIFLDSDDILSDDYVDRVAAAVAAEAENGSDRHIDLVLSDYARFADGSDPMESTAIPVARLSSLTEVLMHGGFAVHCACVRRDTVTRTGPFDESLRAHEDLDLWWRMALLDPRIAHTETALAYYRDTPNSLSKKLERMVHTRLQVMCDVGERLVANRSLLAKCGDFVVNDIARLRRWLITEGGVTWKPGSPDDNGYRVLQLLRKHGFRPKLTMAYQIANAVGGSRGDEIVSFARRVCSALGIVTLVRWVRGLSIRAD